MAKGLINPIQQPSHRADQNHILSPGPRRSGGRCRLKSAAWLAIGDWRRRLASAIVDECYAIVRSEEYVQTQNVRCEEYVTTLKIVNRSSTLESSGFVIGRATHKSQGTATNVSVAGYDRVMTHRPLSLNRNCADSCRKKTSRLIGQ